MNHRHLFQPVKTPPEDGWGSYEDTERDSAEAADAAAFEDLTSFAVAWTERRFNECREAREVQS
jgi:hypothetical protein